MSRTIEDRFGFETPFTTHDDFNGGVKGSLCSFMGNARPVNGFLESFIVSIYNDADLEGFFWVTTVLYLVVVITKCLGRFY